MQSKDNISRPLKATDYIDLAIQARRNYFQAKGMGSKQTSPKSTSH